MHDARAETGFPFCLDPTTINLTLHRVGRSICCRLDCFRSIASRSPYFPFAYLGLWRLFLDKDSLFFLCTVPQRTVILAMLANRCLTELANYTFQVVNARLATDCHV